MESQKHLVGIDLGTVNSVITYLDMENHQIEIISNELSQRLIDTTINVDDTKRNVGISAKNSWNRNYDNTIFYPINKLHDSNGVFITFQKVKYRIDNVKILLAIFQYFKKLITNYIGSTNFSIVVSIPDYFNGKIRKDIILICDMLCINLLSIINNSTALALSYAYDNKFNLDKTVMFIDIGGYNIQTYLVNYNNSSNNISIEVSNYTFDNSVGGIHINKLLCSYFCKRFYDKYGYEIKGKAKKKVLLACEKVKKDLNLGNTANICEEYICNELDMIDSISKAEYNNVLLQDMLDKIVNIISTTNLTNINGSFEVQAYGGSMRIDEIKKCIAESLNIYINYNLNLEESISRGCVIYNAQSFKKLRLTNIIIKKVVANDIYIRHGTEIETIYKKNEPINDLFKKVTITTSSDKIILLSNNKIISSYKIIKKRNNRITLSFTFDENGIVHLISIVSPVTDRSRKFTDLTIMDNSKKKLYKSIEAFFVQVAEDYEKAMEMKNELERYIYKCQRENSGDQELLRLTEAYVLDNPNASYSDYKLKYDAIKQ